MKQRIEALVKEIINATHEAQFTPCKENRALYLHIASRSACQILKELEDERFHGFKVYSRESGKLIEPSSYWMHDFVLTNDGQLYVNKNHHSEEFDYQPGDGEYEVKLI